MNWLRSVLNSDFRPSWQRVDPALVNHYIQAMGISLGEHGGAEYIDRIGYLEIFHLWDVPTEEARETLEAAGCKVMEQHYTHDGSLTHIYFHSNELYKMVKRRW